MDRPGAGNGAVPAELALDHPYTALAVTFVERADGVDWRDLQPWFEARRADTDAIGQTLLLRPIPLPADAPVSQQGHDGLDGCLLDLSFTTASPDTWWEEQRAAADALREDGVGEILWTAPFVPTVPGTDTYTDRLW